MGIGERGDFIKFEVYIGFKSWFRGGGVKDVKKGNLDYCLLQLASCISPGGYQVFGGTLPAWNTGQMSIGSILVAMMLGFTTNSKKKHSRSTTIMFTEQVTWHIIVFFLKKNREVSTKVAPIQSVKGAELNWKG